MILDFDISLNIGVKFKSVIDGTIFELIEVIEYEVINGKRRKLQQPIYKFKFLNDNRPPFTTRHEDIRRAHIFKSWIKI